MASVTLHWLASWSIGLSVQCLAPGCPERTSFKAAEALAQWGDQPLDALKRRFRCKACGAKGAVNIDLWGQPGYPAGEGADFEARMARYRAYWETKAEGPGRG